MDLSHISAQEFENMTFDLLQASGLKNLIWRTPGPDGGRDIEGEYISVDFSRQYQYQKWYIECKKYSSSIDWPTVWQKLSYAESKNANFLLLVTNSNPSPNCEMEISNWNSKRKQVSIRCWRGYELENILLNYPIISIKYGLLDRLEVNSSLQYLMIEVMKISQAAYVSYELGAVNSGALEASAAVSELVSIRDAQIRQYGKAIYADLTSAPQYPWLVWIGECRGWDDVGVRALLTLIRYISGSNSLNATSEHGELRVKLIANRFPITGAAEKSLTEVAIWANVEIKQLGEASIAIASRR